MKKTLLTIALAATSVVAFAQGKVTFGNDSNHYFVLGTTLPADNGLGGGSESTANNTVSGAPGAILQGPLPSGVTLVAGLFAGTSSSSLSLQTSTTALTGTGWFQAGRMANRLTVLETGIPGGVSQWFQVVVYDMTDLTPRTPEGGAYWGASQIFSFTPGSSITYPLIINAPGWTGNLVVNAVPEPSSFALAGLGMASLLIFRRRK